MDRYVQMQNFCLAALLNRYTVVKPYRGFESLRLRHFLLSAVWILILM